VVVDPVGGECVCVIDVCSAVPVPDDTGRHQLAGADRDSRYRATRNGIEWCRKTLTDIAYSDMKLTAHRGCG
jgi:hypothetical protein